jgi:aspartate dehydrogenase
VELPTEKRQARIVLLGYGAINRRVATLLQSRASAAIIVGVMVRRPQSLGSDILNGAAVIASAADLIAAKPDVILEAASREAVCEWGCLALRTARRFVVSSGSALVDDHLRWSCRRRHSV